MRYSAGGDGLVAGALTLVGATVTWVVAGPEVAPQVLALSALPCTIALAGAGLVLLVAALTVHRRRAYLAAWLGAGLLLMTGIGGLVGETWRALGAPDGGWLATVPLAALVIHAGLDRAEGGRIRRATAVLLLATAGLVAAGATLGTLIGVPAWEVQSLLCAAALGSLAVRCARHPLLPETHRRAVVGGIAALAADSVLAVSGLSGAWFIPQAAVAVGGTVALLSVAWRWTIDATHESDARVDELVGDLEEQRAQVLDARTALHDARTLLAGLRAAADALAQEPTSNTDRRELELAIAAEAARLARLLEGRNSTGPATCRIDDALSPLVVTTSRRGVDLRYEPSDARVAADDDTVAEIVQNLVQNAMDHAPRATVHVTTEIDASDVWVNVADDGPGVPVDLRESVLAPGVRGETSAGEGIGLAAAARLAARVRGDLRIAEAEQGARFTVRLPRAGGPLADGGRP